MLGCYPAPVKVSFIKPVARIIVNANYSIVRAAEKLCVADCI
jgi:hypothetical protein